MIDWLRRNFGWVFDIKRWFEPSPAQKQVAFTIAFVSLAAKMAKADGVAVEVETEAFEKCFYVPPEERANVLRVFHLASKDVAGFEVYAERIASLFQDNPAVLRDVFECLFHIAAADGVLHHGEEAFLKAVADRFGFSEGDYEAVRHFFVLDEENPYHTLGVAPDISDAALRTHYKQLVIDNHPDKLAGQGVPAEFLVVANRKLAAINAAYEAILAARGKKGAQRDELQD